MNQESGRARPGLPGLCTRLNPFRNPGEFQVVERFLANGGHGIIVVTIQQDSPNDFASTRIARKYRHAFAFSWSRVKRWVVEPDSTLLLFRTMTDEAFLFQNRPGLFGEV